MYIYFTNIHMYRSSIGMCAYIQRERENNHQMTYIHIVDILIIAKFLLIPTTTSTHCTVYTHTDRHTDSNYTCTYRHTQTDSDY